MIGVGLTDEEKREAIAKACGKHHYLGVLWPGSRCTACGEYINDPVHDWPDYFNDLNAMAEAENARIVGKLDDVYYMNLHAVGAEKAAFATARQRADAFLASLPVHQPQPEKI